jgi:hypothetical protein
MDIHLLDKTIKWIDGQVFYCVNGTVTLAVVVIFVVVIQVRLYVHEVVDEHTLCFVADLVVGDTHENVQRLNARSHVPFTVCTAHVDTVMSLHTHTQQPQILPRGGRVQSGDNIVGARAQFTLGTRFVPLYAVDVLFNVVQLRAYALMVARTRA